jgi:hypothetical protein
MNTIQESLSFDDVLIEPRFSDVQFRFVCQHRTQFVGNLRRTIFVQWKRYKMGV